MLSVRLSPFFSGLCMYENHCLTFMSMPMSLLCLLVAVFLLSCCCSSNEHLAQFNGFDWFGRRIEVREDRFVARPGGFGGIRGGFMGAARGGFAPRGAFMGGRGGFMGGRGGFGGGMGGYMGGAPDMSMMGGARAQFPVDPYAAEYGHAGSVAGHGGYGGGAYGGAIVPESKQIMVGNVSRNRTRNAHMGLCLIYSQDLATPPPLFMSPFSAFLL